MAHRFRDQYQRRCGGNDVTLPDTRVQQSYQLRLSVIVETFVSHGEQPSRPIEGKVLLPGGFKG